MEIHLAATLRASALSRTLGFNRDRPSRTDTVSSHDLRETLRREELGRLIVLVVDCSDSMGLQRRISATKGAALSFLSRSRVTGTRISVIGFRDDAAQVVVPPTGSSDRARRALSGLSVGGATPMAAGLEKARELLEINRRLYPAMERVLVLLTDGEANVPLVKGGDVDKELTLEARALDSATDRFVVIHTGEKSIERMRTVALKAGGEYYHVDSIAGSDVTGIIGG